ncbi:MAG: hypothetical protein KME27_22985 [Lyngbya sp. HA4199-MV5]|jgi:hypothetical protein|nr:hypothetical protein [Lyngbya sp. HA4199-MV5]
MPLATRVKHFLLLLGLALLVSGCYDVDLLNIELKEDLSSNVTFIVSPLGSPEARKDWTQQQKDDFTKGISQEFEKCSFKVQRNLKYDSDGISGSQSFSALAELEQAINCLSFTGSQIAPIQIKLPEKLENLFQNTYKFQIDLRSPHMLAASGGYRELLQPLNELRILMPGKIAEVSIKNESPTVRITRTSNSSQSASFQVSRLNLKGKDLVNYYKLIGFDSSGVDVENLQETQKAFEKQTGVDVNDSKMLHAYIDSKIPPFTSIIISSNKAKVDIAIVVAIVGAILTAIATIIPTFISKK